MMKKPVCSMILAAAMIALNPVTALAQPAAYIRSNGQFVGNGSEYPRGFWVPAVRDAEEVFSVSPEAAEQYRKHRTAAKWFGILNWGALGAFVLYSVISSSSDSYDSGTGVVIFALPWVGGIYMGAKSSRHLLKAMNIVNGVPVDQARTRPMNTLHVPLLAWSF